jgi:hypothetical protein
MGKTPGSGIEFSPPEKARVVKETSSSGVERLTGRYPRNNSFRAHFTRGGIFCKDKNTTKCIFSFFIHNMLWIAGRKGEEGDLLNNC